MDVNCLALCARGPSQFDYLTCMNQHSHFIALMGCGRERERERRERGGGGGSSCVFRTMTTMHNTIHRSAIYSVVMNFLDL